MRELNKRQIKKFIKNHGTRNLRGAKKLRNKLEYVDANELYLLIKERANDEAHPYIPVIPNLYDLYREVNKL